MELLLISAESGSAVNLGGDRNLRAESERAPHFGRYINKLRFVLGEVEVVYGHGAIVRARDR